MNSPIAGQLSEVERGLIQSTIRDSRIPVKVAIEVGTWYGGGSTLHILKAMHERGEGQLWGIEADRAVFEKMSATLEASAEPELMKRFTPVHGFSVVAIPGIVAGLQQGITVDFVFLDGGDDPLEQIVEFRLLADRVPVGGHLLSHDAKLRKGKWFRPYISDLSNWETEMHDVSAEGLLVARKTAVQPSVISRMKAEFRLLIRRLNPAELAAVLFPPWFNGWVLARLPKGLALRLSQGRK